MEKKYYFYLTINVGAEWVKIGSGPELARAFRRTVTSIKQPALLKKSTPLSNKRSPGGCPYFGGEKK